MRRHDIVSGILILFIIDFAIAAPVLVQEKNQAVVDVAHLPKDVVTVLGKRGDDDLEKLAAEYFKTWGRPMGSSDAHASSSTAIPDPLIEPSSPSSTTPMSGSLEGRFNEA